MRTVEVATPDTPIATAARDLCREVSSPALTNHCERTYVFGAALGGRENQPYDPEVLYVASMLHDLGLTERFDGPDDFEAVGAEAAHRFLRDRGWESAKADLVREAISLHMRVGTEDHERKEVPLLRIGAAADVMGWGLEDIPDELVGRTLETYPRLGVTAEILAAFEDQIRRKPESWLAMVADGVDLLDRIREAPFEE